MPSLDDLSDLAPPISNTTARLYVAATVLLFVWATACTARPLALRAAVLAALAANVYLILTMPHLMGHVPGFDPLIGNFAFAALVRALDLYFLRGAATPPRGAAINGAAASAAHIVKGAHGREELRRRRTRAQDAPDSSSNNAPAKTDARGTAALADPYPATALQAFDYLLVNQRLIRTTRQVKAVPAYEAPPRRAFLAQQALTLVASYLALDLLCLQPAPRTAALFSPAQDCFLTRLHDVTAEELVFRLRTNANLWASLACLFHYVRALVALAAVGSGLWAPADFPPLLGSLSDAESVRGLWGRAWHQLFTAPYGAVAGALVPRAWSGLGGRYARNLVVFGVSMLAHMVQPLGVTGGAAQVRASLWFFPAQVGAMMYEDAVCAAYLRVFGAPRRMQKSFVRLVGYMWVVVWTTYSCSIWVYPTLRRGGEGMMPYSLIAHGWVPGIKGWPF